MDRNSALEMMRWCYYLIAEILEMNWRTSTSEETPQHEVDEALLICLAAGIIKRDERTERTSFSSLHSSSLFGFLPSSVDSTG